MTPWLRVDPILVQLYLKEEIQAEALVRNLPGFARFLPIAALFHGQVLSVAALARDAGCFCLVAAGDRARSLWFTKIIAGKGPSVISES